MNSSIAILVVIPLFLGCKLCCKAQETVYDDYDENSNETAGCISKYRELNSYILKQQDILDKLTEAFFRDGEDASQFVKINYNFKLHLNSTNNESNGTMEDDSFNCTDEHELYIWSSSALYMLGPKPLFWLTLFAVNVGETSVTIELPCLCGSYDRLLSRLTYLVRYSTVIKNDSKSFSSFFYR